MPEREDDIMELNPNYKLFVRADTEVKPNFLFFWHRRQVKLGRVEILYRDGVAYAQLKTGPHMWFCGFHRWRIQRINQSIELLQIKVGGRVKGPDLNRQKMYDEDGEEGGDIQLAGMNEFACEVTATLRLSCGITDVDRFLRYRDPLSVFLSKVRDMVHDMISNFPYDQYGGWATLLRDELKKRLKYTDSSEKLIGMQVEDVYIDNIQPNTRHDRNMIEMYQQVERARRELVEARDDKKRDKVVAENYAEQGGILNIAPSILALQNSPIGKALIERDADLKKLMVAAGLNPGVSVQAITDPQGQLGLGGGDTSSIGYLQPPVRSAGQLPPPANTPPSMPQYSPPGEVSGELYSTSDVRNPFYSSTPPPAAENTEQSVDATRQEQELAELREAGFMCAGKGQMTPAFDDNGQPVPGSKEWALEAYVKRPTGYLTIAFHCPPGYPMVPPRVQMRAPGGGGLRWTEPNTVRNWQPNYLLVNIARELNESIPD